MQHYFCVHPTVAGTDQDKGFRPISTAEATESGPRRPPLKPRTVPRRAAPHFGPHGRERLRVCWIYFLEDGRAAPFSPSRLC